MDALESDLGVLHLSNTIVMQPTTLGRAVAVEKASLSFSGGGCRVADAVDLYC
jgi:hypothetical protein